MLYTKIYALLDVTHPVQGHSADASHPSDTHRRVTTKGQVLLLVRESAQRLLFSSKEQRLEQGTRDSRRDSRFQRLKGCWGNTRNICEKKVVTRENTWRINTNRPLSLKVYRFPTPWILDCNTDQEVYNKGQSFPFNCPPPSPILVRWESQRFSLNILIASFFSSFLGRKRDDAAFISVSPPSSVQGKWQRFLFTCTRWGEIPCYSLACDLTYTACRGTCPLPSSVLVLQLQVYKMRGGIWITCHPPHLSRCCQVSRGTHTLHLVPRVAVTGRDNWHHNVLLLFGELSVQWDRRN